MLFGDRLKIKKKCDTHDICFWLLMKKSKVELAEFCYQAWLVWKEWCWAVHHSEHRELRSPLFNVSGLLNEFYEANKEGPNHSTISLPTPVK